MSAQLDADLMVVRGIVDGEGRLMEADQSLADLHARAGGRPGGLLAVPQIAALARLARRLGIVISRGAIAADGDHDLDLWVRAEPSDERVELSIGGWTERPAYRTAVSPTVQREADFVRAASDWIWETDESLRITMVSAGAGAALDRASAELIGQPLTNIFRFREQQDGALPILLALAERRSFDDQVAELRHGGRNAFRLAAVPLIDGTGGFAGFRGSATAIAAALKEQAANDEATELRPESSSFGGRLDRALRDPLDHIISDAEGIGAKTEGPLNSDYAGYAADIASAGRHLLSLVDDLVDLQAIERPGFQPAIEEIDLAQVARQAAGLLGKRAMDGEIRLELPDDGQKLAAKGEYKRALQILMNLLTNALRYSPPNGAVRISAKQAGDFAAVCVADDGKGIEGGDQGRIFEKFERIDHEEPGGTGLGLYISRRLAKAMGGDLTCESAPGEGARFTLTLPLGQQ